MIPLNVRSKVYESSPTLGSSSFSVGVIVCSFSVELNGSSFTIMHCARVRRVCRCLLEEDTHKSKFDASLKSD
jgi:hypothetical protein